MEKITRRLFLRHSAAVTAAGAAITVPDLTAVASPASAPERFEAALEKLKAAASEIDPSIARWDIGFAVDASLSMRVCITALRQSGHYHGDGVYEAAEPNWRGEHTRYSVKLMDERVGGARVFRVYSSMDSWLLPEAKFNTFIGRRVC